MMLVFRSNLWSWTIGSVFLSLFLSVGGSLLTALEGELSEESVFFPGGVANPRESVAYVSTASGIEAIDLGDGSTRWTADSQAKPLMVSNGKLIAQESAKESDSPFVIVVLNAFDGKPEFRSANIAIDSGTPPGLREQEISFADGKLDAGALTLNWNVSHHYRGGANPPLETLDLTKSDTILTVHLNLKTQKLQISQERRAKQDLAAAALADVESLPYVKNSTWHRGPWVVGKKTANLIREKSVGETYFTLEIHDGSKISAEQRIRLRTGATDSPALVTPDGEYVVVDSDPQTNATTHSWVVCSVETGQKVGLIESRSVIQEPSVIGQKIFFITEDTQKPAFTLISETLCAVDLQTSKLLWKHALRTKRVGKGPKLPQ
jgi:hypothetical protein